CLRRQGRACPRRLPERGQKSASRAFQPHARAKKLPRAAECLVYSLTPSGVLAENHPKNRGFVGILRGQKCLRRGQKCLKRRFFMAISRWRLVADESGRLPAATRAKTRGIERAPRDHSPTGDRREKTSL